MSEIVDKFGVYEVVVWLWCYFGFFKQFLDLVLILVVLCDDGLIVLLVSYQLEVLCEKNCELV